ncbi:putative Kinase-like domain-containing protein [Seiridium cardinale]
MSEAELFDILFVDQSQGLANSHLPTPNDIDGSEVLLHESMGSRIVRIHERFVIKFGIEVSPIEAHNMLYVSNSTTVPVPKVFAIYQRQEEQNVVTYIVMQYVPGTTLLDLWGTLDQARKTAISKTLRTYFDQLRQLRQLQHPGYFGNITGGPPLDDIFSVAQGVHEVKKSVETEEELINHIIRIYSLETGERTAHKARYYQHVLPNVLRSNGSPIFTHNDFQRKNVMVQPDGTLVIIDWEFSSWYPAYWEYSSATFANGGWDESGENDNPIENDDHYTAGKIILSPMWERRNVFQATEEMIEICLKPDPSKFGNEEASARDNLYTYVVEPLGRLFRQAWLHDREPESFSPDPVSFKSTDISSETLEPSKSQARS